MRETPIKTYHFSVVEKVTDIRVLEGPEGLYKAGDKQLILVEFQDEKDEAAYFEKLQQEIDPEKEAVRILANQDTQYHVQRVSDELDFLKARKRNSPVEMAPPSPPSKK